MSATTRHPNPIREEIFTALRSACSRICGCNPEVKDCVKTNKMMKDEKLKMPVIDRVGNPEYSSVEVKEIAQTV
jgi:hypothetical protein